MSDSVAFIRLGYCVGRYVQLLPPPPPPPPPSPLPPWQRISGYDGRPRRTLPTAIPTTKGMEPMLGTTGREGGMHCSMYVCDICMCVYVCICVGYAYDLKFMYVWGWKFLFPILNRLCCLGIHAYIHTYIHTYIYMC